MSKILVVEDDRAVSSMVADFFEHKGHTVEVVNDGREALDLLRVAAFDVIILDWQLPRADGLEVLRTFRQEGGQTPVIMLTAMNQIEKMEEGLYTGADDYLTKPFQIRELAARVASLLRRPSSFYGKQLKIGDLQLDTSTRMVKKAGKHVHLNPKEYALLEFFMLHPNQMFSSDALLERIWSSDSEATTSAITVALARLRQKIDDPESESLITTVRGSGYILRQ